VLVGAEIVLSDVVIVSSVDALSAYYYVCMVFMLSQSIGGCDLVRCYLFIDVSHTSQSQWFVYVCQWLCERRTEIILGSIPSNNSLQAFK
jgi:hypothetical protein